MKKQIIAFLLILFISGCKECHCEKYDDTYEPDNKYLHSHKYTILHTYGEPESVVNLDSPNDMWVYHAYNIQSGSCPFYVFFNSDTCIKIKK